MRIIFSTIALFFALHTSAQRVFVAPIVELSETNQLIRLGYGVGAGMHLQRWLVGAYGMHLPKTAIDERNLTLTFGGLWLAYQQPASTYLTVNLGIKGAFGNAQQQFDRTAEDDRIWLLTPEVGVEVSLGKYCKLGYAAGYRMAGDVQLTDIQNRNFYTLVNTFMLKIGRFK